MERNDLLDLTVCLQLPEDVRWHFLGHLQSAEQQSETAVRYACMFQFYAQLKNKLACINKVIDALQEEKLVCSEVVRN